MLVLHREAQRVTQRLASHSKAHRQHEMHHERSQSGIPGVSSQAKISGTVTVSQISFEMENDARPTVS
jgi:hypothetical protein